MIQSRIDETSDHLPACHPGCCVNTCDGHNITIDLECSQAKTWHSFADVMCDTCTSSCPRQQKPLPCTWQFLLELFCMVVRGVVRDHSKPRVASQALLHLCMWWEGGMLLLNQGATLHSPSDPRALIAQAGSCHHVKLWSASGFVVLRERERVHGSSSDDCN